MYLRITQRRNRDGSTVAYYALAESVWNADAKQPRARVIHRFGRADQLDRTALERLVKSINRVLEAKLCDPPKTPDNSGVECRGRWMRLGRWWRICARRCGPVIGRERNTARADTVERPENLPPDTV
jgi:hypothetical protein